MQLQSGTPEDAGLSSRRIRHFASLVMNWVTQGITPALVMLVARRGIIVLHEAFGQLTPAPDAPAVQRDTIYPLASLTKPITATAAMILVEDGLLSLNRPVVEYIPEFVGQGKEAVLVHHLLTHTSGLRNEDVWLHAEKKHQAGEKVPTPAETQHPKLSELLFLGYDTPLWKAPGMEMSYCDYGYELIGEMVRRISGKSLPDFAKEWIFAPLGMRDTWYIVPDTAKPRIVSRPLTAWYATPQSLGVAEMPSYKRSLFVGIESREYQEMPWGNEGVYSTAMDMAIFGQMFLNRGRYGDTRILSPASVAAMTRNQIPGIGASYGNEIFPEAGWGLGWNVHGDKKTRYEGTLRSPQTFSHVGAGGVILWVDPLYELVGVYFSVVLGTTADSQHLEWPLDLLMNAVTAAVSDE